MKKRALVVELNPYHGEILPGFVHLLQRLDYKVDVLIRKEVEREMPFSGMLKDEHPDIFSGSLDYIVQELKNNMASNYDVTVFASNVLWEAPNYSSVFRCLGFVPSSKIGTLFIEHNLSSIDDDDSSLMLRNGRIATLLPYGYGGGKTTKMVNPHYFGSRIKRKTKSLQKKKIVVVGASSQGSYAKNILYYAVRQHLDKNFEMTIINADREELPNDLKSKIYTTPRLNFSDYYAEIQSADFILTMFNSNNTKTDRYLNGTTSGTVQISLGFGKPMIIDTIHASRYGFTPQESVQFPFNSLSEGFEVALSMSDSELQKMRDNLKEKARSIAEASLTNLEEILDMMESTPIEEIKSQDQETIMATDKSKELEEAQQKINILQAQVDHMTELNRKTSLLVESRRYRLASKLANNTNLLLPPNSTRRKALVLPKKIAGKGRRYFRKNKPELKGHSTADIESQMKLINESGYFDPDYYRNTYEELRRADIDPLLHYVMYGGPEHRNPSKEFNGALYAHKNYSKHTESIHPLVQYIENKSKGIDKAEYGLKERRRYEDQFTEILLSRLRDFETVIVMVSVPWGHTLKQRPHHLAKHFAGLGVAIIYVGVNDKTVISQEIEKNIFLLEDDSRLEMIPKSAKKNIYYWDFSPTYTTKVSDIKDAQSNGYKIVYDYIDDIHESISGDVSNPRERFESLALTNPAMLIASAANLQKELQNRFPRRRVLLCENAVELDDFSRAKMESSSIIPDDMRDILKSGKPIVGYYGAIAPWLDYKLINELTATEPHKEFVFIGEDYQDALRGLELRSNVHFLGAKKYKELANYSYLFDCAIIPFQEGDIAKSTSPVKLFEYMAMGLPTVCTKDLKECEGYEYVYMSMNAQEFKSNIDRAIKAKSTKKAQKALVGYAEQNTWRARAESVLKEISKTKRRK